MKFEKSCGAVVIKKFGNEYKVLLIQHVNGGHWSFPKGHVEGEESEKETAFREIYEETGLKVIFDADFRYVNTYSPSYGVVKNVVYFLAAGFDSHVLLQESELCGAQWLTFDEAKKIITYHNDLALLETVSDYIRIWHDEPTAEKVALNST